MPAGTITVRCLLGSFAEPAVGVTVTLDVRPQAGGEPVTRTAVTQEQGRATFADLVDQVGDTAVASVELGGQTVRSQPIPILPTTGSRLLLVKGAASPEAGAVPPPVAGPSAPHGGRDVPPPGKPFVLDGRPAGTVVVGTLTKQGPVADIEVTLTITPTSGQPIVKRGASDDKGRVVFEGLLPPQVPAGSKLVAEATIVAGGEPRRSEPFELGDKGIAVVLAEGFGAAQPAPARKQRTKLPGPRRDPSLPGGTVRIRIVDAEDKPIADQPVELVEKSVTGDSQALRATTDAAGIATIADVRPNADALYFVGTAYDRGPYQTTFFEFPQRGGVAVDLRVFPTTDDVSVVKSAAQFEVRARENDLVEVLQAHEVLVTGDAAFWPAEKLVVEGADGSRGLTVLARAERWLEHQEDAPFATVSGPLPPGEIVHLSVAYLVEHDGAAEIRWRSPLPLVETTIVVPNELGLEASGAKPGEAPPHSGAADVQMFTLGPRSVGTPVELTVTGLPVRPTIYRTVGYAGGLLVLVLTGVAVALRPRQSLQQRLLERRGDLLVALDRARADGSATAAIITELDAVYHRLDAFEGGGSRES